MNIFRTKISLREINFSLVESIERQVLVWLGKRRYRLIFFVLVIALLTVFSYAPYINLFFNTYLVILVSVSLSSLILDIDARPFFMTSLVLFILTSILWFIDHDGAEMIGNYIFIILLAGSFKTLLSSGQVQKEV